MSARRFFYWYLPFGIAVVATLLFAAGFVEFLRGDIGTSVAPLAARSVTTSVHGGAVQPLILGDSLARGTGDQSGLGIGGDLATELKTRSIPARPAVNLAVNGAKTTDLERLLTGRNVQRLIAQSNVIIVSIGGNDLWGEANESRTPRPADFAPVTAAVLDRLTGIVKTIRSSNPTARIFIVGLYNPFARTPMGPMLGRLVEIWNARLTERFAYDGNITIVPTYDLFSHRARLSPDEFHPNDEGYALIARRIADSL